jgi:hypothetical protein
MIIGEFNQKANWFLVGFVFGCIFIIIILLYIKVLAERKAQDYIYDGQYYSYIEF